MRRILAAVAAIAMVVGGFVIRATLGDPQRGRPALRLWCIEDVRSICEPLESSTLEVVIQSAQAMEAQLTDPATVRPDLVLTTAMWQSRFSGSANPGIARAERLASSPFVAIEKRDVGCKGVLSCLRKLPGTQLALPSFTGEAAGPAVAAAFLKAGGISAADAPSSDAATTLLADLQSLSRPTDESLVRFNSGGGVIQAVVTTAAVAAGAPGLSGYAQPTIQPAAALEIVLQRFGTDARSDSARDRLRSGLLAAKWTAGAPPGAASVELTNAAYEILTR